MDTISIPLMKAWKVVEKGMKVKSNFLSFPTLMQNSLKKVFSCKESSGTRVKFLSKVNEPAMTVKKALDPSKPG